MLRLYVADIDYTGPDRLDITSLTGEEMFTPSLETVNLNRSGLLSNRAFEREYLAQLSESYRQHKHDWDTLVSLDEVTIVYSTPLYCFRYRNVLLNLLIHVFGAMFMGDREHPVNRQSQIV